MDELRVTEDDIGPDCHVVAAAGEIHIYSAPYLKQPITEAIDDGKRRIVIDLSEATYIDDTGLGVLTSAWRRLRHDGGRLAVVGGPDIAGLLEMTGLDQVFLITDTRDEAIAALDDAPLEP
jgi:anti-sigma B factor antagonist